jgi:hypothetical protein
MTDLSYKAKGRNYSEEDIYITDKLKDQYDVALCHPKCALSYEDDADIVVFRNTGSVIGYKDIYSDFLKRVSEKKLKTFNSFDGKADMKGKQYLLDLTAEKYPVIPTVDSMNDISVLPKTDLFVIKPKDGADSIGLDFVTLEEINERNICPGSMLIQPAIDFQYEVSFYFVDDKFEYALYAPDKSKRWILKEYDCTVEDMAFARSFIEWNTVTHGIQRVDACRTKDGELLLVELEDLNPYLSILDVDETIRYRFLNDMMEALEML